MLDVMSMSEFLRMSADLMEVIAASDAGLTKKTLYEVCRSAFHRATYDRAVASHNAVNGEIAGLIQTAWGRK